MINIKRCNLISIVLAVTILLALFVVGCKETGKDVSDIDPPEAKEDNTEKEDNADMDDTDKKNNAGLPIVDEKLTLSILTHDNANMEIGNNMPVAQELENRTNIHLDFEILSGGRDQLKLIMTSMELPDIIAYNNAADIDNYGIEGSLIPLQDLIDEYGHDIKKALDNPLEGEKLPYKVNPWAELTAEDGNIYTIPTISATSSPGAVWVIRSDWLDKVGKGVPDTIDDLYEVLKAFKDHDPNGNGEADEIPLAAGQGGGIGRILPLINAFGAHIDFYVHPEEDTIKYGPIEPEFKEGLEFLHKLYSEGLIEDNYINANRDEWLAKATGNQTGFMHVAPAGGMGVVNTILQQENREFEFIPIAPPKGPRGHRFKEPGGRCVQYRTSITSSNKYPVETMRYLNYLFTEEGTTLVSYGVEGLHYNMVDGKPMYTDYVTNNPDGRDPELARIQDGISWWFLPYQVGWESHFQAMKESSPWVVDAWKIYREPGIVNAPMPLLKFTSEENLEKGQLQGDITAHMRTTVNKYIMGEEPLDTFNDYVEQIKKLGLEDLLKIYNNAYNRYKDGAKR